MTCSGVRNKFTLKFATWSPRLLMKALTSFLVAGTVFGISNALSSQGPAPGNRSEQQTWNAFVEFAQKYKKPYLNDDNNSMEVQQRYSTFKENLAFINEHNQAYDQGIETFGVAVNALADLTEDEFNAMKGYRAPSAGLAAATFTKPANMSELPAEWDWRTRNVVTPVKDQRKCGSCWAFSAVAAMETAYALSTGTLESFSEQELVDCTQGGSFTCTNGGIMDPGFDEIITHHKGKIQLEKDYPYTGLSEGVCKARDDKAVGSFTSYVDIPTGDEDALLAAVATKGVVAAGIDSTGRRFRFYSAGLFNRGNCSSTDLDHAVAIVGFGMYKNTKPFWLVKNSWGDAWGEKGYVKMRRNKDNQCGIATVASYPVMSKNN